MEVTVLTVKFPTEINHLTGVSGPEELPKGLHESQGGGHYIVQWSATCGLEEDLVLQSLEWDPDDLSATWQEVAARIETLCLLQAFTR